MRLPAISTVRPATPKVSRPRGSIELGSAAPAGRSAGRRADVGQIIAAVDGRAQSRHRAQHQAEHGDLGVHLAQLLKQGNHGDRHRQAGSGWKRWLMGFS